VGRLEPFGSAYQQGGLAPGDELLEVDGCPLPDVVADLSTNLLGRVGTVASFVIQRPSDGTVRLVRIQRQAESRPFSGSPPASSVSRPDHGYAPRTYEVPSYSREQDRSGPAPMASRPAAARPVVATTSYALPTRNVYSGLYDVTAPPSAAGAYNPQASSYSRPESVPQHFSAGGGFERTYPPARTIEGFAARGTPPLYSSHPHGQQTHGYSSLSYSSSASASFSYTAASRSPDLLGAGGLGTGFTAPSRDHLGATTDAASTRTYAHQLGASMDSGMAGSRHRVPVSTVSSAETRPYGTAAMEPRPYTPSAAYGTAAVETRPYSAGAASALGPDLRRSGASSGANAHSLPRQYRTAVQHM